MTTFLLDLWQDLRAKRLWPVAVALLAATVAVPVVLSKPAAPAPTKTDVGQASNTGKLPAVTLDASSVNGSHLNIFKEKNPFDALSDSTGDGTVQQGTEKVGDSVSDGAKDAAGGSTSSTGGSSGGGGGSVPTDPNGDPLTPGVHWFTYTVDLRFGPRSDLKTYKGVTNLEVLPDGDDPVISFMGVKDGNTAMFFIADPAFRVDGEGKCQPTPDNCMFLFLKTDDGHDEAVLSAQNGTVEYDLQLTGLHVKNLDESEAVGDSTPDKSSKRRAKERVTLMSMPKLGLAKR